MTAAIALLVVVTCKRFAEFIWDRQNTQRLRAASAVEFGGLYYPAVIVVHAGWLAGPLGPWPPKMKAPAQGRALLSEA